MNLFKYIFAKGQEPHSYKLIAEAPTYPGKVWKALVTDTGGLKEFSREVLSALDAGRKMENPKIPKKQTIPTKVSADLIGNRFFDGFLIELKFVNNQWFQPFFKFLRFYGIRLLHQDEDLELLSAEANLYCKGKISEEYEENSEEICFGGIVESDSQNFLLIESCEYCTQKTGEINRLTHSSCQQEETISNLDARIQEFQQKILEQKEMIQKLNTRCEGLQSENANLILQQEELMLRIKSLENSLKGTKSEPRVIRVKERWIKLMRKHKCSASQARAKFAHKDDPYLRICENNYYDEILSAQDLLFPTIRHRLRPKRSITKF